MWHSPGDSPVNATLTGIRPGVFPASAGVWVEIDEERLRVCRVTLLLGVLESASLER